MIPGSCEDRVEAGRRPCEAIARLPGMNARHPHDLFTTPSRPGPIVTGMHTNAATVIQPVAASVLAISSGRLVAFLAAIVALIGVVIGGVALARPAGRTRSDGGAGTGNGRDRTVVATALGLIAIFLGGVVMATSDGGIGNGNGLGGAIVATVLGVLGIALGRLARARARRGA